MAGCVLSLLNRPRKGDGERSFLSEKGKGGNTGRLCAFPWRARQSIVAPYDAAQAVPGAAVGCAVPFFRVARLAAGPSLFLPRLLCTNPKEKREKKRESKQRRLMPRRWVVLRWSRGSLFLFFYIFFLVCFLPSLFCCQKEVNQKSGIVFSARREGEGKRRKSLGKARRERVGGEAGGKMAVLREKKCNASFPL
nr:hypothetical protein [Pandoravirus massiliensis]